MSFWFLQIVFFFTPLLGHKSKFMLQKCFFTPRIANNDIHFLHEWVLSIFYSYSRAMKMCHRSKGAIHGASCKTNAEMSLFSVKYIHHFEWENERMNGRHGKCFKVIIAARLHLLLLRFWTLFLLFELFVGIPARLLKVNIFLVSIERRSGLESRYEMEGTLQEE